MAVEYGDHASGFRHMEVITFINNEILTNGGGPDFYTAFCLQSWNEIEDQLHYILIDPHLPRSLKRAYAWSALALSVRVLARQREQQAHLLGLSLDLMGEQYSLFPSDSVSEVWQLRQQREEAITQLLSTQASLQMMMRECDLLRQRLFHLESYPLFQNMMHGSQLQPLGPPWIPLHAEYPAIMGVVASHEAQMTAETGVLYVPGNPNSWPLAVYPSVTVPVPYQFLPHVPLMMSSPFMLPVSSVLMEAEAGVAVPFQIPPAGLYLPAPFTATYPQEMALMWDQSSQISSEAFPAFQDSVPPRHNGSSNQEENVGRSGELNNSGASGETCKEEEEIQRALQMLSLGEAGTNTDVQSDQKMLLSGGSEPHSHDPKNSKTMTSLESNRSLGEEEGAEGAHAIPVWARWSQVVKESPKKQQPDLKKASQPEMETAEESQPAPPTRMNWVCPKCNGMNFSWRKICYKCKKVCIPIECRGVDPRKQT